MAENARLDGIEGVIRDVAQTRFSDRKIYSIKVEENRDFDGDPVFIVTVVYDEAEGHLDPKKTAGITRHVRSKLSEMREFAFPIFSFISNADAERLAS